MRTSIVFKSKGAPRTKIRAPPRAIHRQWIQEPAPTELEFTRPTPTATAAEPEGPGIHALQAL